MRTFIFAVLVFCTMAATQEPLKNPPLKKRPPIPQILAEAKTVYLDAHTDMSDFHYKHLYNKLREWNRWLIVNDPKKADIVLLMTTKNSQVINYQMSSQSASATTIGNTTTLNSSGSSVSVPLTIPSYVLYVIDPKTNDRIWRITTGEKFLKSNEAKQLIKDLRKAVEGK